MSFYLIISIGEATIIANVFLIGFCRKFKILLLTPLSSDVPSDGSSDLSSEFRRINTE